MSELAKFRAIHMPGLFIPGQAQAVALCLLFERIYLPRNIELVAEFAKAYRFHNAPDLPGQLTIEPVHDTASKVTPLDHLQPQERKTADLYLFLGMRFAQRNSSLFGEVSEPEAFDHGSPFEVDLVEMDISPGLNRYRVRERPLVLTGGDEETIPSFIARGYVPLAMLGSPKERVASPTAKQLAATLAVKSVEIALPGTRPADAETILEARDKLRNHLPPFWSAMLKLSVALRGRIQEGISAADLQREATDLVDSSVRPALIDLTNKLEKERRDWFYKILSPIGKGLRLLVGSSPLSQQQLVIDALLVASEVAIDAAKNMHMIEALKQEVGLTYLLELSKGFEKSEESST